MPNRILIRVNSRQFDARTIGLSADDWLILQPTRVIPRKGIELAIVEHNYHLALQYYSYHALSAVLSQVIP